MSYESVIPNIGSSPATTTIIIAIGNCPGLSRITITPTFSSTIITEFSPNGLTIVPIQIINSSFKDNTLKIKVSFTRQSGYEDFTFDLVFQPSPVDPTSCSTVPLPVELSSFTGLATQSGISLNWSTASETDNSHFEVERSADGKSFEKIGAVTGHGNSTVALSYTFIDRSPVSGTNYYRLKQVDFDKKYEYSNTIAVTNDIKDALYVSMAPNPCRGGNCEVVLRGNQQARETLLQLKDMSGRVVLTKLVQNTQQSIYLTREELKAHRGMFILTATSGNHVVHQRVVLE